MPEIQSAEQLKDSGNREFQLGNHQKAVDDYTAALQLQPEKELKCILYRNRAMTRLKVDDFEGAETDCDKGKPTFEEFRRYPFSALELDGVDAKAL
jgi:tetratricopeptide (TPR) repeat protein